MGSIDFNYQAQKKDAQKKQNYLTLENKKNEIGANISTTAVLSNSQDSSINDDLNNSCEEQFANGSNRQPIEKKKKLKIVNSYWLLLDRQN